MKIYKVSIIGTVGVPACYGGFESLVENLLPAEEIDTIYCSKKSYTNRTRTYKNSKLCYLPLNANGIQSIPYDIFSILHSLFFTKNNLLILGVSGAIAIPFFKTVTKRKVITNIDGLEWKRDKWSPFAKWFLKLSEKIAVKWSDTVIADNAAIADHVENTYGVKSEVIAYGGDHAVTGETNLPKSNYFLGLCRIEPENNVSLILEAFSKLPTHNIKFIGNWNNSEFGSSLKKKYSKFKNIEIIDPIYDVEQLFEIRKLAKGYIHGHSAGGTNPSLVEMMFFDIPIVCFDCNYNRASTEENAIYFKTTNDLVSLIESNAHISKMNMKEIAQRRYTWQIVKKQYLGLFNET